MLKLLTNLSLVPFKSEFDEMKNSISDFFTIRLFCVKILNSEKAIFIQWYLRNDYIRKSYSSAI